MLHGQHVPKLSELIINAGVITIDAPYTASFDVYNLNAAAVQLATVAPNSSSDSNVPAAQLVLTNRVYDDLTERGQIIYNSDGSSHLAEAYDAKLQQLHSVAESTDDVVYMLPNISSMYYEQPRCSRSALGCQKLKALPTN